MIESESPGAVAALGASVSDQLGRRVIAEDSSHQTFTQAPIRAKLDGSDRCEAVGISVRGYSPVLDYVVSFLTPDMIRRLRWRHGAARLFASAFPRLVKQLASL